MTGAINFTTLDGISDLLDKSTYYARMRNDSGRIFVRSYYTSTNAATGAVKDYLEYEALKNGETATETKLRSYKYATWSAGGTTVHPIDEVVHHTGDAAADIATTEFDYEWHTGTTNLSQVKTTRYVVENSTSSSDALERLEEFDLYGTEPGRKTRTDWSFTSRTMRPKCFPPISTGTSTHRR